MVSGAGRTLAVVAGLCALAGTLLFAAPDRDQSNQETAAPNLQERPEPAPKPPVATPPSEPPADRQPSGARNVTPDAFTRRPGIEGDLVRVAPRRPPSPDAEATTPDQETSLQLLARPVATSVDHLVVDKGSIELPGIRPVPLERECGSGSAIWPCGMMARTALRRFIGLKSIRCPVPDGFGTREETITARCTLAGRDLGEWIVASGWAEAEPGGPYVEAEEQARREGLGLWRR